MTSRVLFTHTNQYYSKFPGKLEYKWIDGNRWYIDKETGMLLPGATTVISHANKDKPHLVKWKERKGEARALQIMKMATERGTKLHKVIEYYLRNKNYKHLPEWEDPKVRWMFQQVRHQLSFRIDNILSQERKMFSRKMAVAGTPDVIGDFDRKLSIIDIKGTGEMKKKEWLEGYWVQLAMYWAMFTELTGKIPSQLVIIMISEQMEVEFFIEKNVMKYLTIAQDYIKMFKDNHPITDAPKVFQHA